MLMRRLSVKGIGGGHAQVGTRRSKGAVDAAVRQDITLIRIKKMQKLL